MAMFSAAVRARGDLPPVSMKDIYLHPTVRLLAAAMDGPGRARELAQPGPAGEEAPGANFTRSWECRGRAATGESV